MDFEKPETLIGKSNVPPSLSRYADPKLLQQYSDKFQKLTRWDLYFECIGSCAFAGSIYALLFYAFLFWGRIELLGLIILWPFVVIAGLFLGAISATIVSLLFIPINALLDWPLSSISQSFVIGGLAGFLSPALVLPLKMSNNFIGGVLLGPLTAMTIGHLTAYWLTRKTVTQHNRRFGVEPYEVGVAHFNRFHFRIIQLFIFTAWVAVGFALISMLPPEMSIFWVKLFLVAQAASAFIAILIIWVVATFNGYRKKNQTAVQ